MIPAKRSPDGFVAQRLWRNNQPVGPRGPWVLTYLNVVGDLAVKVLMDEEVDEWPDLLDGHGVLLRGEAWESPPVEVDGAMWSRRCPHCSYMCCSATGPVVCGEHLCNRGGAHYLIRWRT
jgi:hypothetical protein